MELWTVTLTGINSNETIEVSGTPYRVLDIKGLGNHLEVQMVDEGGLKDQVRVSDRKATFKVFVNPGVSLKTADAHEAATVNKNIEVTITPNGETKKVGTVDWSGWTISLEKIAPDNKSFTVLFDNAGWTVNVITPIEGGITSSVTKARTQIMTLTGSDEIVNDCGATPGDTFGVTFTVTTRGNVIPNPRFDDLKVLRQNLTTNGSSKGYTTLAGSATPRAAALVKKTENPNEWEITVTGIQDNTKPGETFDLHIDALMMPQVVVTTSGSGVNVMGSNSIAATVERDSTGTEWYTATFNFKQTDPKSVLTLAATPVDVKKAHDTWADTTDGVASGTPSSYQISTPVKTADGYSLTVRVERAVKSGGINFTTKYGFLPPADGQHDALTINVGTVATVGHKVELKPETGYTAAGNVYVQNVNNGADATFTIDIEDGYKINNGADYTVSYPTGHGVIVRVPKVTTDMVIDLDVVDISNVGNQEYHVFYAGGGLVKADGHGTLLFPYVGNETTPVEEGTLHNGTMTWKAGLAAGGVLSVTARGENSGTDMTKACVTVTQEGGYMNGGTYVNFWTVDVHDVDEPVHITFKTDTLVKSSWGKQMEPTPGDVYPANMTIANTKDEWYDKMLIRNPGTTLSNGDFGVANVELKQNAIPTRDETMTGDTFSFILMVADGCKLESGMVENDTMSTVWIDNEPNWAGARELGYHAERVTVKFANGPFSQLPAKANVFLFGSYIGLDA